jgi:hypothetical protein
VIEVEYGILLTFESHNGCVWIFLPMFFPVKKLTDQDFIRLRSAHQHQLKRSVISQEITHITQFVADNQIFTIWQEKSNLQ